MQRKKKTQKIEMDDACEGIRGKKTKMAMLEQNHVADTYISPPPPLPQLYCLDSIRKRKKERAKKRKQNCRFG